jgi:hypothetical protein
MKNRDWEQQLLDGPYDVRPKHNQITSIKARVVNAGKKRIRSGLKWMVPITFLFAIITCAWIFNIPFPIQQVKLADTLSNNNILRIIEQGNPDPDRAMLYKENVGNNGLLIFTKKVNAERQGMTWEVGYVNKLSQNWIRGGETWVDTVQERVHPFQSFMALSSIKGFPKSAFLARTVFNKQRKSFVMYMEDFLYGLLSYQIERIRHSRWNI